MLLLLAAETKRDVLKTTGPLSKGLTWPQEVTTVFNLFTGLSIKQNDNKKMDWNIYQKDNMVDSERHTNTQGLHD